MTFLLWFNEIGQITAVFFSHNVGDRFVIRIAFAGDQRRQTDVTEKSVSGAQQDHVGKNTAETVVSFRERPNDQRIAFRDESNRRLLCQAVFLQYSSMGALDFYNALSVFRLVHHSSAALQADLNFDHSMQWQSFDTPFMGQQVITLIEFEQTTSLLLVLIELFFQSLSF